MATVYIFFHKPECHIVLQGSGIFKGGMYIYNIQQWHAGDYFCKVKTAPDEVISKSLIQVVGKLTLTFQI